MAPRFFRQRHFPEIAGKPGGQLLALFGDQSVLADVIGRQRQQPVVEQVMQVCQVVERRVGGCERVSTPVIPIGFTQAMIAGGHADELPQPLGATGRAGVGVVVALDHGQQGDFHGEPALVDRAHDMP